MKKRMLLILIATVFANVSVAQVYAAKNTPAKQDSICECEECVCTCKKCVCTNNVCECKGCVCEGKGCVCKPKVTKKRKKPAQRIAGCEGGNCGRQPVKRGCGCGK